MKALWFFFLMRRRGEAPLGTVFWRDMVLVGSAINITLAIAAITYLARGGEGWIGALIFFAALPYSIFLVFSVWNAAARTDGFKRMLAQTGSLVWLVGSLAI